MEIIEVDEERAMWVGVIGVGAVISLAVSLILVILDLIPGKILGAPLLGIMAGAVSGIPSMIFFNSMLEKKGVEIVMDGNLEDQVKFDLKKWWLSLALFGPFILAGILLAFMGVIVIGVKVISYVQAELGVTIIIEGGKISLASLSVYSGIPLLVSVFAAIIASNIYERKNRKASS